MRFAVAHRIAPLLPRRARRAALVLAAAVVAAAAPARLRAQSWNDPRSLDLVRRATERRAQQLADTGLVDYRATAHGYLTFLAQLGEGFTEPPKIVKADELALEILWKAPNLSRQRIVGRRDTLLLPTDINYHRDHLGIVQNNFPDIIRLGDGDEVLDVPHPLSAAGMGSYDFALGDSLKIRLPDRVIEVYAVRVRPKDDRLPRAVGAVFIDKAEAQVVRMAFSFTRAALRDQQLEDVSIVLENALVEGRFWLPRRQEIEIRRTGTFLDYPARGIIRGRWEVADYQVNTGLPLTAFGGPEIVQLPMAVQRAHPWGTRRILDSLPDDVRAVTDADVRAVQEEARALVRAEALARARRTALSARRVSDFARVNRVEGLALGAGLTRSLGGGRSIAGYARYGLDDARFKWRGSAGWQSARGAGLRLEGFDDFREAGDAPEVSGVRNSIAAQEFGSDYTDPYRAAGGAIVFDAPRWRGLGFRLTLGAERQEALGVHAAPARGRYEPTLPARSLDAARAALRIERPTALALFGTELRVVGEARALRFRGRAPVACGLAPCASGPDRDGATLRGALALDVERPVGATRLVLQMTGAGVAGPSIPAQELVYLGGPVTAPGYAFHELVGRVGASQRVEWRVPVPFPSVPLGRFGRITPTAALAPFANAVYLARPAGARAAGWYPSVGLGGLALFELLRVDVGRGLRDGRWTLSIDVSRDYWGIL